MKKPATALSLLAGQPERVWPDLFSLYRNADGTTRVEYEAPTARREWALRWKLNEKQCQLAQALMFLTEVEALPVPEIPEPKQFEPFGGSNVHDVHKAAVALEAWSHFVKIPVVLLSKALCDELKTITDPTKPKSTRHEAKKKIESNIAKTLDALVEKGGRKAHGSAVISAAYYGEALLAWSVLDATHFLVHTFHELPTKKEVKNLLMKRNKKLQTVLSSQWASAFKKAGLTSLPRASLRKG